MAIRVHIYLWVMCACTSRGRPLLVELRAPIFHAWCVHARVQAYATVSLLGIFQDQASRVKVGTRCSAA